MRVFRIGILLVTLGVLLPATAFARLGGSTLCTKVWNACASVQDVEFSGNELTFKVSNISTAAGTESSYIRKLLLRFKDPVTVTGISVEGTSGSWSFKDMEGKIGGLDWDIMAMGDGGSNGIYVGDTAIFTITFADDESDNKLAAVGHGFQGLGFDAEDSEWAIAPEPITMVLLGTGLAGVGASALRRRRREEDPLDG